MTLLIDADYIVYKACASCETEIDFGNDVIVVTSRFSEVMETIDRDLYSIANDLGCFDDFILFFSSSRNFRKLLYPAYKGHRNRKKPCGYRRAINALKKEYQVIVNHYLEADDAIGIFATKYPGHIIVSPDKDMRQIPGELFDLSTGVITITPEEGQRWHYIQTMSGDQTDGYSGIPGVGVKRAAALLDKEGCTWDTVVKAYKAKGLSEDDALLNARLAKILHNEHYDSERKQILYWTPPDACNRTDDGAGVSAKTA
jgi:5'-3' exonuclease